MHRPTCCCYFTLHACLPCLPLLHILAALLHKPNCSLAESPYPFVQHPGFDFSSAEFSGGAPNPHTFMRDVGPQ